ncbi:MAG: hypothetical protein R2726_15505 [Acidimicrobiales bacterium]
MTDGGGTTADRWWRRATSAADRHDRRRRAARREAGGDAWPRAADPGPVASAAAAAKLVLIGVGGVAGAPLVGWTAARNNRTLTELAWRYPDLVADVLAGRASGPPFERVGRAPAAARYVITSDLHRGPAGATDWPGLQDVTRLYLAMLDWYGDRGWGLVEDGDVEDFWMVGGSTYGVVYELARWVGHARRSPAGRRFLRAVHGEHLRRIVDHNAEVYDRIETRFHRHERYHRIVGNHDDAYLDEGVVDLLRQVHPGLEVLDALVLEGSDGGVGLVTHGHHTDPWNAPGRSGLGKLGTWLGSTVADAPFTSANPGLPTAAQTRRLLDGAHTSVLTEVSTVFGANRELYSMDEVILHDAWRERFGPGGPWLVLGHTHLPLVAPVDPRGRRSWDRYLNAGCGVFDGMVTAVEWDGVGGVAGGDADVALVAWHWADDTTPDGAVVAEIDGRPVARRRLRRTPGGGHVAHHGADDHVEASAVPPR